MMHTRARRTALRSSLVVACVALVLFVLLVAGTQQPPVTTNAAGAPQWSEQFGGGEVFPACASSALPVNPIVCVANVGNTCYLSNSCGQKSAAGVIQCDGICGNKVETDILTPSRHYVGTYDDFRGGYEGGICTLAGRPAWTGNYACAPDLNTYGCTAYDKSGGCSSYGVVTYYAESRHNGNWGSFSVGQGACAETGIEWVECGPAISAPPDSNCPVASTPAPTPATPSPPTPPSCTTGGPPCCYIP
jgi:hypothetical protein